MLRKMKHGCGYAIHPFKQLANAITITTKGSNGEA